MTPPVSLLLDTCAIIWLAGSARLRPEALEALEHSQARSEVFVSPVSAWELGTLTRSRGARPARFLPEPNVAVWFATFMAQPGLQGAVFTADIALHASMLPAGFHEDPADRLLVATARRLKLSIVTRDEKILAYARAGHVQAMAC